MKRLLILFFFLPVLSVSAQYKVRFIVKEITPIRRDSIFIAVTFNSWNSLANSKYKLEPYGNNERSILLTLPAGDHAYKYSGLSPLDTEQGWAYRSVMILLLKGKEEN